MTKVEKLLNELIALPSVNPAFEPSQSGRTGEQRVAEFLAATFARSGLELEYQQVLPERANLLARLAPKGKAKRRILLAPHMDTVNGAVAQFTPQRKGDRIYGRGACDTKGSVAAMTQALLELAESKQRPSETEIVFAGLVDEEDAQSGSRALAASRLKAELAIVGEPTRLEVITAHKGSLWLKLLTRGKAAHGARPELGVNAVHEMAKVVDLLQTKYAKQISKRSHRLLGRATISVGAISGGTQANIVPDRCWILVDRRTLPGETETGVRREIQTLLRAHGLHADCADSKLAPCLPMETDAKLPLVQQFLRGSGQTKPAGVHYFCDASVLAGGGIPSVVFGPGDIAQAHTADEWISRKSLEGAVGLLLRFLRSLP